ncbi:MAG: PEP-CTERM sorting domain-containing protein [Betaproteobacteria bacterium]
MTRDIVDALAALALCAAAAQAAPLVVSSDDMRNGDGNAHGGTYNDWDANYNGAGSPVVDGLSGGTLSGGTGVLTDGVVATDPWVAVSNQAGTGRYVGWVTSGPTITFHFASTVTISDIALHVDNSLVGGVTAPDAAVVDGTSCANPSWATASAPQTITLSGLNITGNSVVATLSDPTQCVFLSEIEFNGTAGAVPEPASVALMLGGLGLLAFKARRRA